MIKASKTNSSRTTIYDIAKKAGVSIATVSRVLNNSPMVSMRSKEKVQSAIESSGYIPSALARGLSGLKTGIVGISVPVISDTNHALFVSELEKQLLKLGYSSIISCTNLSAEKRNQDLHLLASKSVDGIIVVGSFPSDMNAASDFASVRRKLPIVVVGGLVNEAHIPCVYADEFEAMLQLTLKLLHSGHRKLIYLNDSTTFSGTQKLMGYQKAMKSITPPEKGDTLFIDQSGDTIQNACEAVNDYIHNNNSFSGILAADDSLAIGALKALRQNGLTMPVVGYNNTRYARSSSPELSSIDNHISKLCKIAVENLEKMMRGEPTPPNVIIAANFVARETYAG